MKHLVLLCSLVAAISLSNCNNQQGQPATGKQEGQQSIGFDTAAVKALPPEKQNLSKLSFDFKEGDVLHYRMKQVESIVANDSVKSVVTTVILYTKRIKSVHDDMAEVGMKYDSMYVDVEKTVNGKIERKTLHTGSTQDEQNPLMKVYSAAIGVEVTLTIDKKTGFIEEISGLSPIVKKLAGDTLSQRDKEMVSNQIKGELYVPIHTQEVIPMPKDSDLVKRTWTKTAEQSVPPAFIVSTSLTYNLASVAESANVPVADIKASMVGKFAITPQAAKFVTIKKSALSGTGRILLNAERGYTLRKDTKIVTELQYSAINPRNKEKGEFKNYQEQIFTLELIK